MANKKKAGKKTGAMSGLKMVGGAAAGAAAGSLVGPLGAAVGAVVGGIAGASADEIAASKPAKSLARLTKKGGHGVLTGKPVRKARSGKKRASVGATKRGKSRS
jgi:hypothetical protein